MSFRHIYISAHLYGEDVAEIATAMRDQAGATAEIVRDADGRPRYVHGWFKALSSEETAEIIEGLRLPIDIAVMVEGDGVLLIKATETGQITP
jgi:hypothetical protein